MEETGNRSYGANVYVATGASYAASRDEVTTGRTISAGTAERFGRRALRCERKGARLEVAVFEGGRRITRVLSSDVRRGDDPAAVDEGWLTWFGPVEDLCTLWSDKDPSLCQVIRVDELRAFARSPKRR